MVEYPPRSKTMQIGIILYSQTGNTRQVCQVLEKKLSENGHTAQIDEIKTESPVEQGSRQFKLAPLPDLSRYEAIVLAGQVQAFSLSAVMKAYLPHLGPLKGSFGKKPTALLLTKHLKSNWTGGTGALKKMRKAIRTAGGHVTEEGIVHWSSPEKEREIEEVCGRIAAAF